MARPAPLFVSHSSIDNVLTRSLCVHLDEPIAGAEPFKILVDFTELEAGKPWPIQLHEWMARCHAAVVLLSKNAIASPWVLKEATILAWRQSLDPNFHLFTVQFPDVTDEMLREAKFEPLMLGQIQKVTETDPLRIAEVVRATLNRSRTAPTPLDDLVAELAIRFDKVHPAKLRQVAEKIHVDEPPWIPDGGGREMYVEAIARKLICENLGGYDGVHELVDHLLGAASREEIGNILDFVAPFWVPAQAAGKLAMLGSGLPRRAAAMNGKDLTDFTALMYVRRAHPLSRLPEVVPVTPDAEADLFEHIVDSVCEWFRRKRNRRRSSNEEIIERIREEARSLRYVVVPPPVPQPEDVRRLLALFEPLKFVFGTGDRLEFDGSLTEVEWVDPPLDLKLEAAQYDSYFDALDLLSPLESQMRRAS